MDSKYIIGIVAVILIAVIAGAVLMGGSSTHRADDELVVAAYSHGGEPEAGFDPILGWNYLAEPLIQSTLLKMTPNMTYTNDLASSWEANDNFTEYTVKKGDSLYSIANTYNTTVDELKKINNLKSNILQIGQILSLPQISSSDINQTYIVQKGDNLYKIASSFNTTVDELKKINNLSSNLLQIGQILQLTNVVDNNIYTVKKGDSLYKIATIYNTTVDNLKKLNNLTSNSLSVGQKLKIPILNTDSNIYVVKKGDNLYNIANNFNTIVDNIKKLNNLSSNLLQIGQQLIIPN